VKVIFAKTYSLLLEAEASVAHGSPAVDDTSCSILDADKPNRHFHVHVHGHVHERMFDHALVGGCSAKPSLVKMEEWRVEPAPVDPEMLLDREFIERHGLANSNVHGWASNLCSPLCLGVVES